MRRYVSGKADQDERFDVTGYRNRQFTWTHARIAALISAQIAARPQGPHCENAKIWPFCVSATGLGLKLYDALLGTTLHAPFPRWVEYVREHYMEIDRDGNLAWFVLYYDPIEQRAETFPHKVTAYSALTVLLYPPGPRLRRATLDAVTCTSSPQAATTGACSMTLRMKPLGFQFGVSGCASPLLLVHRTMRTCAPTTGVNDAPLAEAVLAFVLPELRLLPSLAAVAGEIDTPHASIPAEGDAAGES
jgi:hypothetical protein